MSDEPDWAALTAGEEILEDPDELLWRQVNPIFIQDGVVTSQAFRPTVTDEGRLSTSRASVESAEEAFRFHTEVARRASAGSWAISVAEVADAGCRAIFDANSESAPPPPCTPGHTSVDLRPYSKSIMKRIGAKLSINADKRGRQHP